MTPPVPKTSSSAVVAATHSEKKQVGPGVHPYTIDEFFTFRGVLFGRGVVMHADGDVPKLFVRLPMGRDVAVGLEFDPLEASTPTRTCFHFSIKLSEPLDGTALEATQLIAEFAHERLLIEQPGAQRLAGDRFLQSEAPFWNFIAKHSSARILEIGSRARSGIERKNLFHAPREYVGFDISAGPNVDVVGDAHSLSNYFPADYFDAVFSVSVWEHLAMPWKVSLELNRVMKVGGLVMVNTHQSWPSHEEPWDYFRFSEYSWATLFNAATGFEIVAVGQGSPAVMASAVPQAHLQDQKMEWHYGYLASRCVAKKIGPTSLSWNVATAEVSRGLYPK